MPVITAAAPMTPGTYLRKRREAAGFSIFQTAKLLAAEPNVTTGMVELAGRISLAERDELEMPGDVAGLLGRTIRLDVDVYLALLTHAADPQAETPLPQICRECGCTWNDPCVGRGGRTCAWVAGDRTLCTACEGEPRHAA